MATIRKWSNVIMSMQSALAAADTITGITNLEAPVHVLLETAIVMVTWADEAGRDPADMYPVTGARDTE